MTTQPRRYTLRRRAKAENRSYLCGIIIAAATKDGRREFFECPRANVWLTTHPVLLPRKLALASLPTLSARIRKRMRMEKERCCTVLAWIGRGWGEGLLC